ncbi:MAG: hypothetical protein LBI02_11900, partial [Opitutaceae bacterium]|nr:hypothetical protein [Opitutaceae bacterium]
GCGMVAGMGAVMGERGQAWTGVGERGRSWAVVGGCGRSWVGVMLELSSPRPKFLLYTHFQ